MHISKEAKRQNFRALKLLFSYLKIPGGDLEEQGQVFLDIARGGAARENSTSNNNNNNNNNNHHQQYQQQWTQDNIIYFLISQRERWERGELAPGTLKNFCGAIKLFCDMNDLTTLNWKKITRVLPKSKSASNDRAPTIEEIKKLVEYPERRIKPIVYTMCSSGIRVGAWNYLKWKHVTPIKNNKHEIIAAKLLVYAGEPEECYTFITPEAYNALKNWIDFRASYGEDINDK
jgi:hypothetical protein